MLVRASCAFRYFLSSSAIHEALQTSISRSIPLDIAFRLPPYTILHFLDMSPDKYRFAPANLDDVRTIVGEVPDFQERAVLAHNGFQRLTRIFVLTDRSTSPDRAELPIPRHTGTPHKATATHLSAPVCRLRAWAKPNREQAVGRCPKAMPKRGSIAR